MSKKEDEFEKHHQLWHWVALAIGYNHIVLNDAKTLGEKMYFRLMRDAAVERLVGLGGKSPFSKDESPVVLQIVLPSGMPHFLLRERDIAQMRRVVEEHDLKKRKQTKTATRSGRGKT